MAGDQINYGGPAFPMLAARTGKGERDDSPVLLTDWGIVLAALDDAAEALERYSDVRDGPDGQPAPNAAMTALETVRAAIAQTRGTA